MTPPPPRRRKRTSSGADRRKRMAEHRRASTVCAKALEETPPRTALWDARTAPSPPPPAAPTTPRQHPDESEDDFRARLETVRQLRDRLETDDRMNLACECAKRGVAFDGDDSAAMLQRRLELGTCPRTYASASARKQSRAARRKAQRRANRALGRLSSGPLMDEIRARPKLSPPRAPPPATPLKRGTSLDALDAAWPAWGQEPELVETRRRAADALDRADAARTRAEALDTRTAWASYVVAAAEAERCRRIAVNDELDWANQLERERRQKWAAEAAQREQRRRIREGFARETQGTRWFEGLIERKNEDYEVACPYAAFGCRHCGPRSTISQHLETCPARPHENESPDKLQKDYDIVCPNSFMGCSCTFPLSQLAAHLQTCTYSDTSRASERSQRTDAQLQAQQSAEQERARRLRDESGIALARAAARVARKKGLAPQAEVTIQTVRLRRLLYVVSTPSTRRLDGVCSMRAGDTMSARWISTPSTRRSHW
jgi:hypothetical protein